MKSRRDKNRWVLEPCSRLTINQQIGGALYDFIDARCVPLSDGTSKLLLSCIRDETRMSDPTLQRIFLGRSDSISQYQRILAAIHGWVSSSDYDLLWHQLGKVHSSFFALFGDQFLEEQVILHRPKHKAS